MPFPFSLHFSSALQILSTKFYPTNFVFNLFHKIKKRKFFWRDIHNWWRLFSTKIVTNSSLQSGTLINLLVEDPRLFRAQRSLNNKFIEENNESNYSNIPLPPSNNSKNLKINLWNWKEFEDEMLPRRLTNSDFEKICVGKLVLPSRTDFKVFLFYFQNFIYFSFFILLVYLRAYLTNSSTNLKKFLYADSNPQPPPCQSIERQTSRVREKGLGKDLIVRYFQY